MSKLRVLIRKIFKTSGSTSIQRKIISSDLYTSEKHYRELLENVKLIAVLLDDQGKVSYCNPYFSSLTGYSYNEMIGDDWFMRMVPDSNGEVKKIFLSGLQKGEITEHFENPIVTKNREIREILWNNTILRNATGDPIGTASIGEDITERKRAEQALLEEKNKLSNIAASVPGLICSIRLRSDGSIQMPYVSHGLEDIYGFQPEDLEDDASAIFTLIHSEDLAAVNASFVESANSLSLWHQEFRYYHPKKGEIWIEVNAKPHLEADGSTIWHGILTDNTERKRADEALREEKNKFANIATSVPGLICSFRMRPDGSSQMQYASSRLEEVYGFQPEDLKYDASPIFALIHPDDIGSVKASIEESARTLNRWQQVYRFKHPKKGEIWIEGYSMPEKEVDGSIIWHGIITDITEHKETKEALRESEELFSKIFNNSPMAIAIARMSDGKLTEVNDAWSSLTEFSREESLGHTAHELNIIPFERRHELKEALHRKAELRLIDGEIRTKSGVRKSNLTSVEVITIRGEQFSVALIIDITERKKAELELKQTHRELRSLYDNLSEAIFSYDTVNNKIIQASIAHEAIFGYPQAAFFENPQLWYELILSEDKPIIDAGFSALRLGRNHSHEVRIKRGDGEIRWIEAKMNPTLDANKVLVRVDGIVSDITERRIAENALRESENLNRTLVKHLPHKIFIKDKHSVYLACNDNYAKDLGISPSKIYGRDDYEFFPEEMANAFRADDQEVMLKGKIKYLEEKYQLKGKERWIQVVKVPYRDNENNIVGVMGVFEDITERILARVQLKESEEKYRNIFENVQDVFYQTDLEGRILDVSPSIKKLSGFTREELVGQLVSNLYYRPEDRGVMLQDIINHNELRNYELKLKTKTGEMRYVSINARLIAVTDKTTNHINGAIRDITERKQAEKQVKLLSRTVEQSPVIVVITDKQGVIQYVNPKFTEVTGYTLEEAMGENPRILSSGNHRKEFYKELWDTILSGDEWHGELQNRKKNGELYWESAVISSIVNSKGDISFFVAVKEDITEQKKMVEELISAKERAEESDRLKTAFLHNISHEIRTPLNAIVGFSGILDDPELLPEDRTLYTETIVNSSDQLLSIINDIVNIATIEAGQEKMTVREINLNRMLELLHQQFLLKAQKRNLSLKVTSWLPDEEIVLLSDEIKLTQILTNLIGNAIKFTKRGHVDFGYLIHENEVEFFVEDTGIGIPAEMHDEIFRRFRQVENTSTRQFGGSGLGLSISKAYTELLGGKMWLTSELGKGSIFYFTIPLKRS